MQQTITWSNLVAGMKQMKKKRKVFLRETDEQKPSGLHVSPVDPGKKQNVEVWHEILNIDNNKK